MTIKDTLSLELNMNVKSNPDNKAINSALELIKKAELVRATKEGEWRAIQDLFELGFVVSDPTGTRRIESQLLWQAIYKTVSKMKPLDAQIHGSNVDENKEKIVTDGVSTVMNKGGFTNVLRDKFGVFYRMLLWGDAFVRIGTDSNSDFPIKFQNTSLLNIYVDPYATQMRSPSSEKDVDELVAVYKYSWDEAVALYPEYEKIGGLGEVYRSTNYKELDYTEQQDTEIQAREVEIAHYYNRSQKNYTIFGGSQYTLIKEYKGADYPFMKDGEPYIPFLHFMAFPSSEGFYNYGLGHILYRLAILTRQLNNRAINYVIDNVDPIRMVNVPAGDASKFFNKLLAAQEAQAGGRKGFIINEYSASDPNAGSINIETFRSEPITTEWERLFARLDQEIKRLGIPLDDIDRGRSTTATQIIAEEENADLFVKQILEQNASEFQFAWEVSIEFIKEFVSNKNKTRINMTTAVEMEGQQVLMSDITLGDIKNELSKKNFFVKVNARSGAVPSNIMQQAQISRALSVVAPGSMAYNKLAVKLMRLNDQDINFQDLGNTGGQGQVSEDAMMSETDKAMAGSKPSQPIPAIA